MAIEEKTILFDLAQEALDEIVHQFELVGEEVPERRYVNIGGQQDTAHDCEQLTVTIEQHYAGTPVEQAEQGNTCDDPRTVAMVAEIVRCVPNMQTKSGRGAAYRPPTPDEMNTYSKQRAIDMLVMLEAGAVISDKFAEQLGFGPNVAGVFDVAPGTPSGNMQGVDLNLTVIVPTW